jgi:hypothetical protein
VPRQPASLIYLVGRQVLTMQGMAHKGGGGIRRGIGLMRHCFSVCNAILSVAKQVVK